MKLTINKDGTVTVPLTPVDGMSPGAKREIVLPEPTMDQLTTMHEIVDRADEKAGPLPRLGEEPSAAEVRDANDALRQRQLVMYGPDRPYGSAFMQIIELLTGEHVEGGDLFGWASNPLTCNQLLVHFQNPLPGAE